MTTFADKLRDNLKKREVAASLTASEIKVIVSCIKQKATTHNAIGVRNASYCIDQIRSSKEPKLARGESEELERALRVEGFEVKYSEDMTCGSCGSQKCKDGEHFGYYVTW